MRLRFGMETKQTVIYACATISPNNRTLSSVSKTSDGQFGSLLVTDGAWSGTPYTERREVRIETGVVVVVFGQPDGAGETPWAFRDWFSRA